MENPLFIDTHTHLYLEAFDSDREEVIRRGMEQGVSRFYLPNIDCSTIGPMMELCRTFPGICYPMMGLHPGSVKENFREELKEIEKQLTSQSFAAVGEIGIDLYWDKTFQTEQTEALRIQCLWAMELGLPVVIHARDSFNEIFSLLDKIADERLKGVFHSFTGNREQAKKILSYGFLIGINGIITFKNSGLAEVVREIDLKSILLETDSPYLAPVPYRGKRNESSFLLEVAAKVAEIHGKQIHEIADITTENALHLFKF